MTPTPVGGVNGGEARPAPPTPRLDSIIATGASSHRGNNIVRCVDGFHLSAIAGWGAYCSPRPAMCGANLREPCGNCAPSPFFEEAGCGFTGPYTHVEVGFPSQRPEPWADWLEYADSPETPTETVYARVPVEMVRALVVLHGGES